MLITAVKVAGGGEAASPASSATGGTWQETAVPLPEAPPPPLPALVGVGVTRSFIYIQHVGGRAGGGGRYHA